MALQNSCGAQPQAQFRTAEAITQAASPQEPIVIEKADEEEAAAVAAICQPSSPVEHEEHEEKEAQMNGKIEAFEPPSPRKQIEESIDAHDAPESNETTKNVPVPERPTALTFAKPEIPMMDTMSFLSPVSPMSKQVTGHNPFLMRLEL